MSSAPVPTTTQVDEPYANKAIAAVAVAVTGVIVQFLATHGHFQLSQEGATALTGIVAAGGVFLVSNLKRRGF